MLDDFSMESSIVLTAQGRMVQYEYVGVILSCWLGLELIGKENTIRRASQHKSSHDFSIPFAHYCKFFFYRFVETIFNHLDLLHY